MKQIVINPVMFACKLGECPPGLFVFDDTLGFKSEYGDCFIASSGEYFWGGVSTKEERDNLMVIPCDYEWEGVE